MSTETPPPQEAAPAPDPPPKGWGRAAGGALLLGTLLLGLGLGVALSHRQRGGMGEAGRGAAQRVVATSQAAVAQARPTDLAPPAPAQREVLVEVRGADGQPAAGVLVTGVFVDDHGRPSGSPTGTRGALSNEGELGVLSGPLPRLPDVLRGAEGGAPTAAASATTDRQGLARLQVRRSPPRSKASATLAPGRGPDSVRGEPAEPPLAHRQAQGERNQVEVAHQSAPRQRLQVQASRDNLSATAEVVLSEGSDPHVVLRLSAAPTTLTAADPLAPPSALASDDTAAETAQLRGVIHDERGRGLASAVIEVQGDPATRATALSNARGEFQIAQLPLRPGVPLTLRARHAGFAPLRRVVSPEDPALHEGAPLQLAMDPGGGVEGEVRDRRLATAPPRLQLSWQLADERTPIVVARDGRFRATGLPAGAGALLAQAPGYAPLRLPLQLPAAAHLDEVTTRDLRLQLERAGALSGRVRGSGDLKGLTIQVFATTDERAELGRARSNSRSEFRLSGLPEGRVRVLCSSASGRAEAEVEIRSEREARVELDLR